jgi:hypothetical protein
MLNFKAVLIHFLVMECVVGGVVFLLLVSIIYSM